MAKAAKLHEIAIDQLIPYDKNAKTHSPEQVEKLAASIREFGFLSPILIDEQYNIVAGHGRVLAAKTLGMDKVPAVFLEGLTEAQRRAYIIADNRLTELGGWDMETVRAELEELQADGFDTEITGFDLSDISFTEDMAPEISEEELGELEEKAPVRVKEGDVWQLGDHRLMCGDSTDAKSVEKLMGGGMADLLLTDPPYNVDYTGGTKDAMKIANDAQEREDFLRFLEKAFRNAANVMKEGAAYYCWHASRTMAEFQEALNSAYLMPRQILIWVKSSLVLGRQDYQWRHEPCFYGWKEGAAHYFIDVRSFTTVLDNLEEMSREQLLEALKELSGITTTIYEDKPTASELHPTMKPVGLFKKLIRNSSREGDIVLDLFGGSGTTIIAAEEMGRRACVMEYDPHYCDVIIERWEEQTGKKAVRIDD